MQKELLAFMLPTDKSFLIKQTFHNKLPELVLTKGLLLKQELIDPMLNHAPQHLYYCSTEEIKEGDAPLWCINKNGDTLYPIQHITGLESKDWLKVVATTDALLQLNDGRVLFHEDGLPKIYDIPKIEVERQVAYYNQYGKIQGKVTVEYGIYNCSDGYNRKIPKLTRDNEIIVTSTSGTNVGTSLMPWSVKDAHIYNAQGFQIANLGIANHLPYEECKANAEYIVLAVNNFAAIVKALENQLDRMGDPELIHYAVSEAKQALSKISFLNLCK